MSTFTRIRNITLQTAAVWAFTRHFLVPAERFIMPEYEFPLVANRNLLLFSVVYYYPPGTWNINQGEWNVVRRPKLAIVSTSRIVVQRNPNKEHIVPEHIFHSPL